MNRRDAIKSLIVAPAAPSGLAFVSESGQEIPITSAGVVRVEPGDVVCFTFPMHIKPEQAHWMQERLSDYFPEQKVLVLAQDVKMSVIRRG
jgi:hypothetical protein